MLRAWRRFVFMPEYGWWAEKVCHVFLARPVLRKGEPLEAGHTAVWAPLGDAAGLLANPAEAAFLRGL